MKRKISAFLVATTCIASICGVSNVMVEAKGYSAENTKNTEYLNEINIVNTFIEGIEDVENLIIDENNIIDYSIDDEVITVIVANEVDGFTIYRSLSDAEQIDLQNNPQAKSGLKFLGRAIKIFNAGKWICKAIESVTDTDVCSIVGKALLDTMTPNVEYKVQSYFYKDPNCAPMHSQQCNMYPNAYWKTTVVRA